jgi:hypothetical protein
MTTPEFIYLATSARIIEGGLAGVAALLEGGSHCIFASSQRGAIRDAKQQLLVQRDRLDALLNAMIETLGDDQEAAQ